MIKAENSKIYLTKKTVEMTAKSTLIDVARPPSYEKISPTE